MPTLTLIRDLRLHIRAWERHRIHFGILCPGGRLPLCRNLFSVACSTDSRMTEAGGAVLLNDDALVYRFPFRHEDPRQRGKLNHRFLDPAPVRSLLQALPASVSTGIMTLPHIYRTEELTFGMFIRQLEQFLAGLPCGLHLGVELQNGAFLLPDYFELLARHRVIHVIGDGPAMPSPLEQIQLPMVLTAGRCIVKSAASIDPVWQLGIIETVRRCVDEKKELHLYLCDEGERTEQSLMRLMELLKPDLAKLSPLRRRAA